MWREPEDSVTSRKHGGRVATTYWLDTDEIEWDVEGARGQCDLEKAWRSCCYNILTRQGWYWMRCGGSQRTAWPRESTAVVLLQPIDKTGLSLDETWREPEDSVASRKHGGRVAPTYWLDRAELGWDVEGARGQWGLEKARRSCCYNLLTRHGWYWMRCGGSQRTVWPQDSTEVVLLQPID